jgi:hypothetical protein
MDEIVSALPLPHASQIVQLTPMMEQYFRLKEKAKENKEDPQETAETTP